MCSRAGGVRMGFRRRGKAKKKEKIFYIGRSAIPGAAVLFLSYCLRAVAEEWQTGWDDVESESTSRWQPRKSSLSSQELDRLLRLKIMSLDFRHKNDFPYLWNAVTCGVKASQYKQGTETLTTVCIKQVPSLGEGECLWVRFPPQPTQVKHL